MDVGMTSTLFLYFVNSSSLLHPLNLCRKIVVYFYIVLLIESDEFCFCLSGQKKNGTGSIMISSEWNVHKYRRVE